MTRRQDPLERVRAADPVPVPVEPDWHRVKQHVASASRAEAEGGRAESPGAHARALLPPVQGGPVIGPGSWNRRRLPRVLGVVALCAALATGILVTVAPGGGSSDFLARAAAALTPQPGAILHERWEHVITEPGNPRYEDGRKFGPEQLWIQDDSPHRYRAILKPDPNAPAGLGLAYAYGVNVAYASRGANLADGLDRALNRRQRGLAAQPLELAGTVEAPTGQKRPGEVRLTLTFVPPNELLSAHLVVTLGASLPGPHEQVIENGTDPVSALRAAISEGRAHEAGSAQLDGRTVQRIDIDLNLHPPADAPPLPANAPVIHSEAYAYVEPETFHPVEIVFGRDTYTFLAYEYLSPTAANVALTDIHAQHPNATIVKPN